MQSYLPGYELDPTTWAYLSSLLVIGIFFKFHRFWSVRNLDLLGLIAFAPGLLWVAASHEGTPQEAFGYVWLFTLSGLFLVRLLLDPLMVRRPLLEPNLNASGLTFTGIAILLFLMTNVVTGKVAPLAAKRLATEVDASQYPWFYQIGDLSHDVGGSDEPSRTADLRRDWVRAVALRTTAILAHLAVVIGIVLIGYRHFDNLHTGVAMASLYLILPYTSQMTPRVDHVVPAALLVWAIAAYRRPILAGGFIGLAAGLIGYPLYLMPLWSSYYWRRGLFRFIAGMFLGLVLVVALLLMLATASGLFGLGGLGPLGQRLAQVFGWARFSWAEADGFWQYHGPALRIPIMAAFWALCGSLALWPAQKNLGTLLSCSAAVMLSVQFWQTHHGSLYMAWYLPTLVMTVFRPNLEDRVAVTAVTEGWLTRRTAGRLPWRIEDWLPWLRERPAARRKTRRLS